MVDVGGGSTELVLGDSCAGADGRQIGSTEPGKPKSYPVAKAIPALQEALQLMAEGAKWQIVIPPDAAPGDRDPLDDAGVIIYDLELVSVQPAT